MWRCWARPPGRARWPLTLEDVERALRAKLSGAVLEMNLKALEFGARRAKEDPQCK